LQAYVEQKFSEELHIRCITLGCVDLNSLLLKMRIIAVVGEFEREQMIERTQARIIRASTCWD